MNRREFVKGFLLSGAALSLGIKLAETPDRKPDDLKDSLEKLQVWYDHRNGQVEGLVASVEIAGVPVYCDVYAPEGTMYFLPGRPDFRHLSVTGGEWEEWAAKFADKTGIPRSKAFMGIVSYVKNIGETPDQVVIGPRWFSEIVNSMVDEQYVRYRAGV